MKRIPGLGGHPQLQWMQMSSDLLTKHEINPLAVLHLMASSRGRLGLGDDYRASKGIKCRRAWNFLSAGQLLPIVRPRAVPGCYNFNLWCNRRWCPSGICRWPYSRRRIDGGLLLDRKGSVACICRYKYCSSFFTSGK